MIRPTLLITALAAAVLLSSCTTGNSGPAATARKPNFLLIVADDLGYSDLGAFGGEIATPTLDRLASSGAAMTQFYASPFCSYRRWTAV